jgi:hypothetical protein
LGSAIGIRSFVENNVEEKISTRKGELERLFDIAMSNHKPLMPHSRMVLRANGHI